MVTVSWAWLQFFLQSSKRDNFSIPLICANNTTKLLVLPILMAMPIMAYLCYLLECINQFFQNLPGGLNMNTKWITNITSSRDCFLVSTIFSFADSIINLFAPRFDVVNRTVWNCWTIFSDIILQIRFRFIFVFTDCFVVTT